jgi:hypothetical protein
MTTDIQTRILSAVYACMLPIARLLLRSGVTYRQFDVIARRAFVREAMQELDPRGRVTNTSRVAVKTGISRKEVKRLREAIGGEASPQSDAMTDHSGPLARVLHAWHSDQRFCAGEGAPRDLDFQVGDASFSALVRAVAGDVPAGAVRAELRRAGAVVDLNDGRLRAVKRYYVPGSVDEKAITVLSGMVFPMTAGIAHNADPDRKSDGFIQRYAFSESLSDASILAFRMWSRIEATRFIESMDDWLAKHEIDNAVLPDDRLTKTAGIGVFYYEGPNAQQAILERASGKTKGPD